MADLNGTANENDIFIEGYKFSIDKKDFSIFVMKEATGTKRGYILKIMLGDGKDKNINISDTKIFPKLNSLLGVWCCGLWKNRGKTRFCYKYVVFGKGEADKQNAVTMLRIIVCSILMSSPVL